VVPTFVSDVRLSVMNVGIFWLCAAASIIPSFACQFTAADKETYRRAISPEVPFAERRAAFERSIEACADDPRLYSEYASLLVARRDFNAAVPWIDKGLVLAPEDETLNLRKGEVLVALSEGKQALAALNKAPATGESQFFRGLAYQILENHRAAQESFLDSWKRGNEDPYVLYSLMREDKELGDKAAGLEHFKIMLARYPDSVWIHILLGDAHFQKSEEAEARQEYLTALKLMPDLFEPNFRLAYLAFEAGENGSAEQYYRRALLVKPRHTEANIYLGEALRREGKIPEAIAQLRRAIELDAKSALAYDSLAKSLTDAGRLREAADVLVRAEREFPSESQFPAMEARVLSRSGRTEEAKLAAQRAADIINAKNKKDALVGPK
jgi:tetratricopeptide (TPR) repeat protein